MKKEVFYKLMRDEDTLKFRFVADRGYKMSLPKYPDVTIFVSKVDSRWRVTEAQTGYLIPTWPGDSPCSIAKTLVSLSSYIKRESKNLHFDVIRRGIKKGKALLNKEKLVNPLYPKKPKKRKVTKLIHRQSFVR